MADETISALDKIYDAFDRAVDTADHLLNRSKHSEDKLKGASSKRSKRAAIDVEATEKPAPKAAKASDASATAIVRKPRFYIVESVSATGPTVFVVTDGGAARTECATREFAQKILAALEAAS